MEDHPAPPDTVPAVPPAPVIGLAPEPANDLDSLHSVAAPSLNAVAESERIGSIDVLRGVAVLGILVMNIQSFAMIDAAYSNPTAYGNLEGANFWVWQLCHIFADQKFMTIFSMLFGAGILLMASRGEERGVRPAKIHYRRMGALALFGVLHAYLFWHGDILFSYAICGMVAYLLRKLRPWLLLLLGFFTIAVASVIFLCFGLFFTVIAPEILPDKEEERIREEMQRSWQPSPEQIGKENEALRGGWWSELKHRWPIALRMETKMLGMLVGWRAGGLMLVGMALFKLGVFSARRSHGFYVILVALALLIGVPLILLGDYFTWRVDWEAVYSVFFIGQFNYWASILVSLGWVGMVMLIYKNSRLCPSTRPFAAVGRMAFTNYLMHTLICTTIFYGHGFGYYGYVERVGQILIVFAIWLFQLIVSPIWLHYFRFGPAEYLWRVMTYWTLPPVWRASQAAALQAGAA